MSGPAQISLEIRPQARVDVIDVSQRIANEFGDLLAGYRKALYCSLHTTAGYYEQSLAARLEHRPEHVGRFVHAFHRLFPPDSGYQHDNLELRSELSEEQKKTEPLNADSHLTFIGSGLRNCATYVNRPGTPVYFVDLDGVNGEESRRRTTTVLAFDREVEVARVEVPLGLSGHAIDSVNLKDPRIGFFPQLEELLARHGVTHGRVDVALASDEQHAGLTVNEFETLLMSHDLAEVLKNPLHHVAKRGKRLGETLLRDPLAIPGRTLQYARYDFVQVFNELLDALGARASLIERIVARLLAVPASRFLRLQRSVSLPVSDHAQPGRGAIIQGTYQSPILVQWKKAPAATRRLTVTVTRFE